MATSWILKHRSTQQTMTIVVDGSMLAVALGDRREEKRLKSAEAALQAARVVVVERQARGFTLMKHVVDTPPKKDELPPLPEPRSPAEAAFFQVWKREFARPASWRTIALDEGPSRDASPAELSFLPAVMDCAADGATTLQLVQRVPAGTERAWLNAVAHQARPQITKLVLDTPSQTTTRQGETPWGDLTSVLAQLPSLQTLFVTGLATFAPTTHAQLKQLFLIGSPVSAAVLESLADVTLPALLRLSVGLHPEGWASDDAIDALIALVVADGFPALSALEIDGLGPRALRLLAALSTSTMLTHLRELRLVNADLGDDHRTLLQLAPHFAHLELMQVSLDSLSEDGELAVKNALAGLRNSDARLHLPERYLADG